MSEAKKILRNKLQNKLKKTHLDAQSKSIVESVVNESTKPNSQEASKQKSVTQREKTPSSTNTPTAENIQKKSVRTEKIGSLFTHKNKFPHLSSVATKKSLPASSSESSTSSTKVSQVTTTKNTQPNTDDNFVKKLEENISHIHTPKPSQKAHSATPPAIKKASIKKRQRVNKKIAAQKKPRLPLTPEQQAIRVNRIRLALVYGVVLIMVGLDQITKKFADTLLIDGSVRVFSWLDLWLVYNPGAAFSLFAQGEWQRPFLAGISLVVSIVLVFWIRRVPRQQWLLTLALMFVLGGACGNLIDRLVYGYVIDFISLHYQNLRFPTFNLADSCISVGAALLIADMLFGNKTKKNRIQDTNAVDQATSSSVDMPTPHTPLPFADTAGLDKQIAELSASKRERNS